MRLAPNDPGRARLLPFVLAPVMLVAGCNSGIPDDLEGLACDADGRCADGFVCDRKTNRCVRGLPESDASGANEPGNAPLEPSPSVPEECAEGEVDCASGCALLDQDPENCGGCGARCTAPEHGIPVCVGGACSFACADGFTPCGAACTDLLSDPRNCGACGAACQKPDGGRVRCDGGVCRIACDAPRVACDGACVDTASDPSHCGECENPCADGEVCSDGECVSACPG